MSKILDRRAIMRLMAAAPAAAKGATEQIVQKAAMRASSLMAGAEVIGSGLPPRTTSRDAWTKARDWTMRSVKNGVIPVHQEREWRQTAHWRAKYCEDSNVEALGSVSAVHKRRMHEESAYRQIVRREVEEWDHFPLWEQLMKRFGGEGP